MNGDDVGCYYTTNGEDIWRLISYCREPTATMENIRTEERVGGAVGCLNLKPFIKLVPEKEPKEAKDVRLET